MKKRLFLSMLIVLTALPLLSQGVKDVTSKEAFSMLDNPSTYLIDVRSIAEYVFVGHAEKAFNIPLLFWNEGLQRMSANENFLEDVNARFKPTDVLIFICRSGGRSKRAAQSLAAAGYTTVYNVVHGFEGDKSPEGLRNINGWKNSGLPTTYNTDEEHAYPKKNR